MYASQIINIDVSLLIKLKTTIVNINADDNNHQSKTGVRRVSLKSRLKAETKRKFVNHFCVINWAVIVFKETLLTNQRDSVLLVLSAISCTKILNRKLISAKTLLKFLRHFAHLNEINIFSQSRAPSSIYDNQQGSLINVRVLLIV